MNKWRMLALLVSLLAAKPASAQQIFPDNIYPDTTFAPFYFGVASGDPGQDRVIIWTKVFVIQFERAPIILNWQMANDSSFATIVNSGQTACKPERDFTAQVDVTGLQAGHHYYYRFITADGKHSQTRQGADFTRRFSKAF